jgi:hypothetical protein
MTRNTWIAILVLGATLLSIGGTTALAATGTSSFTGDGNWGGGGGMYAQGFALGTGAGGFGVADANGNTVNLNQFQFYKSGLADSTNVQLAIVNNFFLQTDTANGHRITISGNTALVGLSTNTLNVTSANYAVGAPINFTFNNLALTYGRGTYDQQGFGVFEGPDYAAIFVHNDGTYLTPVLTPVLITNYSQVQNPYDGSPNDGAATGTAIIDANNWTEYVPSHDYGYRRDYTNPNDPDNPHYGDYFKSASNSYSTTATDYLTTFGPYHGDIDFSATFTFTPTKGDFNGDGHFNAADILPMEQALADPNGYLSAHSNLSAGDLISLGDMNGDSAFTNADLQKTLINLKNGQGNLSSVPEPSSVALASIAGIAMLLCGRLRRGRGPSNSTAS